MSRAQERARRALIPATVLLTLTHRCQLACAHCYQARHDSEDLNTAELVALFDELQLLGTLELVFTGGEALLRKDLFELLAEARRRAFAVTLFTNGGPVTPEVARRLREGGVQGVEVSLHASHAALHDGLTGRQGSFARAVRAVELLDGQGLPVLVKSNVLACNAGEVESLRALFTARPRVKFLSDVIVHCRDDGEALRSTRARPDQLAHHFERQVSALAPADLRALGDAVARPPPAGELAGRQVCGAGSNFASVQPDGTVLACVHLPDRPLGNLRDHSFSALWLSSPAALALRELTLGRYRECEGCDYRHVCAKCPALSLREGGALDGHSQQICDRTQAFWGAVRARLGEAPLAAPRPGPSTLRRLPVLP